MPKLLVAILGVSIVGVMVGLALLGWGVVIITFPLLYLVLNVPLLDIFNVHWATYVNSFYDTQAAKRVIPVLASGARIAGIVAGLTLPLLNRVLAPAGIILIWLGTLVVMALLAWFMPRILREDKATGEQSGYALPALGTGPAKPADGYLDNIREGWRYVSRSPFLRWMAVSTLLIFVLFPLLNYRAFQILQSELRTTERISNFLGLLNGVGNLIALPVQLFVLNRLIGRVGLGNTSLIFPAGTLAVSGALVFVRGLPTAALPPGLREQNHVPHYLPQPG